MTGQLTPADAAKRVHLERYDAQRKKWDRLSTRPVSHSGAVVFRWRAEKGRSLLRLSVARADLQPGYVPTISRLGGGQRPCACSLIHPAGPHAATVVASLTEPDQRTRQGLDGVSPELSVVVVTYQCKHQARSCFTSLFETTKGISFEVVVLDNASGDGTRE